MYYLKKAISLCSPMANCCSTNSYQKLRHLGGIQNFLLERGDKPEKRVDVGMVEIEGLLLFYYFTVQS